MTTENTILPDENGFYWCPLQACDEGGFLTREALEEHVEECRERRLREAAPELLETLEALAESEEGLNSILDKAVAAIARARGEQP